MLMAHQQQQHLNGDALEPLANHTHWQFGRAGVWQVRRRGIVSACDQPLRLAVRCNAPWRGVA